MGHTHEPLRGQTTHKHPTVAPVVFTEPSAPDTPEPDETEGGIEDVPHNPVVHKGDIHGTQRRTNQASRQ